MAPNPRRSAWSFLKRPRVEEEVDAELAFHVEMTIQMLVSGGMTPADARAQAVSRFGDMAVVGAECRRFGRQRDRGRSRAEYFSEVRQDVVLTLRQLRRARGFAATAIITLALGIGATAAVFSALYAVVLQPLPFADASRVVQIFSIKRGEVSEIASGAELSAIRAKREAFVNVAAVVSGGAFTLTGVDVPELIPGSSVTAEYFRVLGVSPTLGRGFLESDDVAGAAHVVLISNRVWKRRFASDTSVVGRELRLADEKYTVIGVMPASLDAAGGQDDMWTPLQLTSEQLASNNGSWLHVMGRLAPGVTVAQASNAAADAVKLAASRTSYSTRVGAVVRRYIDVAVGGSRQRLLVLFGAAGFVLLIACVNVANLLLSRGTVRARELAIRAALGAGRGRLVRQLLAESLVLAIGGAIVGVVLAYALVKGLVALGPEGVPRLDQARVNGIVLTFTFAIGVLSSIVVGLMPATRAASPALQSALRDGARGAGSGAGRDRIRALLVATQVALAMTLLAGSGLLIRTAQRLQQVDPGFDVANVMTARLLLPRARYNGGAQLVQTFEQIRVAAEQVPGVQRASLASIVPLSHSSMTTHVSPEGRKLAADENIAVDIRYNSPGYFSTMRMSVLDGRDFARTDDTTATNVAVISTSLAQKLWPGQRAVGRRIDGMRGQKRDTPNWLTVVGVVPDVHDIALNAPPAPTLYMPFMQMQEGMWNAMGRSMVLVVRTVPKPETLLRPLQRAVASIDASVPLDDKHTMDEWLSTSLATARFNTMLLVTLAAIALVLASVGVYGVVAYFVSQRTREIGVRMALGAAPVDIWRLVLSRGLRPIMWGALVGVVLSTATARLLREQLYGVSAQDPTTLIAVVVMLVGVALVATFVPARRAMGVTPARALAAE